MTELTYEATSKTLKTEQGVIHYHEAGEGPVLLLLHGSGPGVSGWANFQGNLAHFAAHFRTIIPDFPGYGKSDLVQGMPVMVGKDAVLALMDGLGIDKAAIVGNSYGGMVGGMLAAHNPERVTRFATIGGIGFNLFAPFPSEGLTRLVEFIEEPTRERIIAWFHSMVYDPAFITDELVDMRLKQALEPATMAAAKMMYTKGALKAIADNLSGPNATQGFAYLPQIQCPTLITWGRDDKVNPLDGALLPMRLIPNAELHVFPKCGHWSMIEKREEFNSTVLAFLQRG